METTNLVLGIPLSLVAGIFLGTFAWPMKKVRKWQWENTWLIYSVWALVIIPWAWALYTVPGLFSVYRDAGTPVLVTVFLFGSAWGVASIGFGIGVSMLGLALGTAIILGLNNALGSILPIIIYTPGELRTPAGMAIIMGVFIMICGIALCAIAGKQKELALQKNTDGTQPPQGHFMNGLAICLLAGIFGAMFNFALVAGKPMEQIAVSYGASVLNAANPSWCISLSGGFIVTLLYCIYRFRSNNSFILFKERTTNANWMLTFIMGFMWFTGVALYGTAVMNLGKLGASIGWPLIQSMAVLSGNLAGLFSGEWKGTGRKPLTIMVFGLLLLVIGISVVSWAGSL
jgi:L-rhamnose-H+ transport protein